LTGRTQEVGIVGGEDFRFLGVVSEIYPIVFNCRNFVAPKSAGGADVKVFSVFIAIVSQI
jgi:hypothetical protein